jgi:hypothetical protein
MANLLNGRGHQLTTSSPLMPPEEASDLRTKKHPVTAGVMIDERIKLPTKRISCGGLRGSNTSGIETGADSKSMALFEADAEARARTPGFEQHEHR